MNFDNILAYYILSTTPAWRAENHPLARNKGGRQPGAARYLINIDIL